MAQPPPPPQVEPLFIDRRDPDDLALFAHQQVEAQFEASAREARGARARVVSVYKECWERFWAREGEGVRSKVGEVGGFWGVGVGSEPDDGEEDEEPSKRAHS